MSFFPGEQSPSGGPPSRGYPPAEYPPGGAGYYPPEPAPQKTAGVAVAALILAFLFFPVGLILSVIALVATGKNGKKGRGLAVAGLVISLVFTAGAIGVGVLVATKAKNITTLADPGCTQGKKVIVDNADLGGGTNVPLMNTKLKTMITGLNAAAATAEHDNVRTAMTALAEDYRQLQTALNGKSSLAKGLEAKIQTDANRIDTLCTLGGAQK